MHFHLWDGWGFSSGGKSIYTHQHNRIHLTYVTKAPLWLRRVKNNISGAANAAPQIRVHLLICNAAAVKRDCTDVTLIQEMSPWTRRQRCGRTFSFPFSAVTQSWSPNHRPWKTHIKTLVCTDKQGCLIINIKHLLRDECLLCLLVPSVTEIQRSVQKMRAINKSRCHCKAMAYVRQQKWADRCEYEGKNQLDS